MNYIFTPSDQYEFQAKNECTNLLIKKLALQDSLENILVFINNNFQTLNTEEKKLTLWESVEFYKNYLKYREKMEDTVEKELYFNFQDKKFSRKGFYINIVTRINCFLNQENPIFFYIGKDFTYGLNVENNIYYKFNFDKQLNMIKLQKVRGIFYVNTILLPYKNTINTDEIKAFQKWSKIKYNKNLDKNKKQTKSFGLILFCILIMLLFIILLLIISKLFFF